MLLQVKELKKYFPVYSGIFRRKIGEVKAVNGVSFSLSEQKVLGLVGESGSGKSTAARAAFRLIPPTAGEVFFLGKDLFQFDRQQLKQLRRQVQFVFQDPYASLNPRKTIGESVGGALRYHGLAEGESELRDRVAETLQMIGIPTDAMNRYPHQFSGGQQQRICIGRAIAIRPKLIVCDEAVSALDVSIQAQILNLLQELQEKIGLSYFFISHDLAVIRHISDDVAVMQNGKILEYGDAEKIFTQPKNSYTQKLLASIPRNHPAYRPRRGSQRQNFEPGS